MQNPTGAIGASQGIHHSVPPLHAFELSQMNKLAANKHFNIWDTFEQAHMSSF